ncbi:hypothetical protein DAMA08_007800 [Martiniozyma asiatica (nom. inval.)]|nr:hypothetical protein DAMA08_007800 [Martiniozyma asiatica]
MSEEEISKEEKLEAARKKFEELKNKNKKKKSKKKGKKKEDGADDDEEKTPTPEGTQETGVQDGLDDVKLDQSPKEEIEIGNGNVENTNPIETEIEKPVDEITEVTPSEKAVNSPEITTDNTKNVNSNDENNSGLEIVETNEKNDELEVKSIQTETPSESKEEEESSFLTTILQSQVENLTKELNELQQKMKELVEQNNELALEKECLQMDLETANNDLETANNQIKKLSRDMDKLRVDASISNHVGDDSPIFSGSEPTNLHHESSFQNLSTFNYNPSQNFSQEFMDINDIKERLYQWRDFKVDMRSWRSIGTGPVTDI